MNTSPVDMIPRNIWPDQTRSQQGQAQEFVIWTLVYGLGLGVLLLTQNDSGLQTGPLTTYYIQLTKE